VAKTATKSSKRRVTKTPKRAERREAAHTESTADTLSAGGDDVTIDRRRAAERRDEEAEKADATATPKLERRKKVNRRRQIDPTTCERDYTEQEVEFMNALDDYKRKSGRMFPTCSEVLEVIHSLGYVKLTTTQMLGVQASNPATASAKPMPVDFAASAETAEQLLFEAQSI
jgi:hypothetical protein